MKRGIFLTILLAAVLAVSECGCSSDAPTASEPPAIPTKSAGELRASYPAESVFNPLNEWTRFSVARAFRCAPVIVVAEPAGSPRTVRVGENDNYLTIPLRICEILRGERTTGSEMFYSDAEPYASYINEMKQGQRYIFCLASAKYLGKNYYQSGLPFLFYLSDSNQVVPLNDDEEHAGILGMTLSELKNLLKSEYSYTSEWVD